MLLPTFDNPVSSSACPKTRSGKILRKTIRRLAIETEVLVPPTIDDPKILDEIREVMQERGIGWYATS